MLKFGSLEIDYKKVLAIKWLYDEEMREEGGLMKMLPVKEATRVRLYTENNTFLLSGDDFEAYKTWRINNDPPPKG